MLKKNKKSVLLIVFFIAILSRSLNAKPLSSAPEVSFPPDPPSTEPDIPEPQAPEPSSSEPISDVTDEVETPPKSMASADKCVSLGLSGYLFLSDMAKQRDDTYGYNLSYEHALPIYERVNPSLGLRFEYFLSRKKELKNQDFIVMPYLRILFFEPNPISTLALIVGMDNDFSKQTSSIAGEDISHRSFFQALVLGLHDSLYQSFWGSIELGVDYHLQKLKFKTSFLDISLQYVWGF